MKRLILLTFLIPVIAKSQETIEPVKNKSNRVILHFKDTTGLFVNLAKILIDRGYDIATKDRELGILNTKPSRVNGGSGFENEIKVVFRDSIITISSAAHSSGYKFDTFYTAKKRKNIVDMSWGETMILAEMLKPNSITYSEVK